MRRALLGGVVAIVAACAGDPAPRRETRLPPLPPSDARELHERIHGVEVADPYRWLEDAADPEVRSWMRAQDAHARAWLARLPGRDAWLTRLRELLYVDVVSAPRRRGERLFYSRRHGDQQKEALYWKEGPDGVETLLLDPNLWSEDGSLSLHHWEVSWDGRTIAYQVSENNADETVLHVMDVASGRRFDRDTIRGVKYAEPSWTPQGDGFYYTWLPSDPRIPADQRPGLAEVRFHRLGTDPSGDRTVRESTGDPRTFQFAELSRDGHWLIVTVWHGWSSCDVYLKDLRDEREPDASWMPLVVGRDASFWVSAWRDRLYVHHDDGAPNWRVDLVDPDAPARSDWRPLVPESREAVLEEVRIVGGRLALTWIRDATYRLELRELDGSAPREIPLPGPGTVWGPFGLPEDDLAWFAFTSFTHPTEIRSISASTGESALYFRPSVPMDPEAFHTEQVFFQSKDGTRVPMFVTKRRDQALDADSPLLLTGYGGFAVSYTPWFRPGDVAWLERGGVLAVANLRGGGEYGETWHEAGMRLRKQNVFDDFLAAAGFLIGRGYTRPARLAIQGASNGGLLVGAALTQRPELFRAVVCAVPLLDMVRYHRFESGRTWIHEIGSSEDEAEFRALLAYSPYHRVVPETPYPSLLLLSADSDDRVDPMHARKFAAAMQDASTGGPVLLRIERGAGHGGADRIESRAEQLADELAFVAAAVGMDPRPTGP